jgi:hypothetical protein
LKKAHWLALLWTCFLIRSFFLTTTLPLFEGFDESAHFAFIQRVFFHRDLPDPWKSGMSREVVESARAAPIPRAVTFVRGKSYCEFWAGEAKPVPRFPPEWGRLEALPTVRSYEAQQTPLYYWLMALAYWPIQNLDLQVRVWLLRCIGVLLASLTVPLGFLVARRVFREDRLALLTVALFCSLPQLYIAINHIGNESLGIPMATAVIALLLNWNSALPTRRRDAVAAGLVFGLALLSKAYVITLIPAAVGVFMFQLLREKKSRALLVRQFALAALVCVVVSGWWYVQSYRRGGTLSGEQNEELAHAKVGSLGILQAARHVQWPEAIRSLERQNVFVANWSIIMLPGVVYRAAYIPLLLAAAGLLLQFIRPRVNLPRRRDLAILLLICGTFVGALVYCQVCNWIVWGQAVTVGSYFYATIAAAAPLTVAGMLRIFPGAPGRFAIVGLCIAATLVELAATVLYMMPFYAGLTCAVERLPLHVLRGPLLWAELQKLSLNSPAGPAFMALQMALWLAGMVAIPSISGILATRRDS